MLKTNEKCTLHEKVNDIVQTSENSPKPHPNAPIFEISEIK